MSAKSKKILTGIGVVFGTVMAFIVSFILAFSLIVNPISLFSKDDSDAAKENEKLKAEVRTLNDTIEHLNTTVDKYKAQANTAPVYSPSVVTTPSENTNQGNTTQNSAQNAEADTSTQDSPTQGAASATEDEGGFSPETVDSTAEQTPEDVEAPIPVIDISE